MARKSLGEIADTLWTWGERLWNLTPYLVPIVVGIGTAWAAKVTAWLSQYAPVSWVLAGLIGATLVAFLWWCIASGLERLGRFQLIRAAQRGAEAINPLDHVYHSKRIDINALRSPIPAEPIEGKTFVDCHLIGPAVILFQGNSNIRDANLAYCDFIAVEENRPVHNVLVFKDITVRGGKMYFFTVLVSKGDVGNIPPGANWLT